MFATSFDGTQIHYEVTGDEGASPLLMSNSLGTALAMWNAQIPALSAHHRVVRYDSRGHGRSDAPAGPYSIEMLARDALSVLDAAGFDHGVDYVGLSMGGMAGMWLAVNAPEVFRRMVFANTAAHLPPRDLWDGRARMVRTKGMEAIVDAVVDRWFTKDFQSAEPLAVAPVRDMILSTDPEGYAASCEAIRDMDQRETIDAIGLPVLVIAGRDDPATPPAMAEEIVAAIDGAKLALLDAAHLSNIEAPRAFDKAVLDFLAGR